jgi:hypothetical protein
MLAFVFSLRQWRALAPVIDASHRIATLDVDVLAACRAAGRDAIDLSSCASDAELEACRASAVAVCDALGEAMESRMPGAHRVLGRHLAHDLLYPIGYAMQVDVMTRRAVERLKPQAALCFAEDRDVFFWDPPERPPDLANRTVHQVLLAHRLPVDRRYCPAPAVAAARPADQEHVWMDAFRRPVEPCDVVAISQGLGWAEQTALLRGGGSVQPVSTAWMNYLLFRDPYTEDQLLAWIREARACAVSREPSWAAWLAGPVLDPLWHAWVGVMQVALRYHQFGRLLCAALNPRVVVTGYDIRSPQRCFAEAVVACGAQPVSILHGGINGMDHEGIRHRRAVGHLAVWSERDVAALQPSRAPGYRIEPIGSLRADIHQAMKHLDQPRSLRKDAGQRPCVAFLTCRVGGLFWFTTSLARHVEAWEGVRALIRRRPDIDVIIKKHPRYDHDELYAGDEAPPNLRIESGPLDAVLERADLVVLVNLETTAVLEALVRGIPVIHVNTAIRGEPDSWVRESKVVCVRSVEELEAALDRLLSDSAAYAEASAMARARLPSFVPATGEAAVARLGAWMQGLSRPATKAAGPSEQGPALACLRLARWVDQVFLDKADAPAPDLSDLPGAEPLGLDGSHMAGHVLNRVTWYPWPCDAQSRAARIWRIHRALPRAWRPHFRVLKRYWVEGFRQDAANAERRPCARMRAAFMARSLSPGEWFRRCGSS